MNDDRRYAVADNYTFLEKVRDVSKMLRDVTVLDPARPLGYRDSFERKVALTRLLEAEMWLERDLGNLDNEMLHPRDPSPEEVANDLPEELVEAIRKQLRENTLPANEQNQ